MVAAMDEGRVIGDVVEGLSSHGWNIVVVDDGSTDETGSVARDHGAHVVRHEVNLGQGAALQTGIDFALGRGARYIVTFDADGQHDPEDIPALLAALDTADLALGSRFLGSTRGVGGVRRGFLRLAVLVSNAVSRVRLTDAHCGLRAFHARSAPVIRLGQNRMAHASELLRKASRAGLEVVEVPVTVTYTAYSRSKGQSMLEAVRILFDLLLNRT